MKNNIFITLGLLAVTATLIFGGIFLTRNLKKTDKVLSKESAESQLAKLIENIDPAEREPQKSPIDNINSEDITAEELPEIDTCEIKTLPTTDTYAEIIASPEKTGDGMNGWLVEIAEKYNHAGNTINNKPVSIQIRNVNSGQGVDYITTKKYRPDGFSPSSTIWTEILKSKNIKFNTIAESLVQNTAGIVFKKDKYESFVKENGNADIKAIIDAVSNETLTFGYTNPNNSTGGLNLLTTILYRYDAKDPLSEKAKEGFAKFQKNVPFVALTTIQMSKAAENGTFDAFILEYQTYINDENFAKNYEFIPYGYEHNNPLIALGDTSKEKQEILKDFAAYCQLPENIDLAKQYGFNSLQYKSELDAPNGSILKSAQKLYKENKDNGRPIVAVFVTDVSGSMNENGRILNLKKSLINSMKYINPKNHIGVVSYSSNVTIEMPIKEFNLNNQGYFKGAVTNLDANGATAIYDGLAVGTSMIHEYLKTLPDAKPMLFLLSDGDNTSGYALRDIKDVLSSFEYPVYTIGYDANIDALNNISSINEAAVLNANTDDIVYQLKMLFEANM